MILLVARLKSLQKFATLTPLLPRSGPRGGAAVAICALKISLLKKIFLN